MSNEQIEYLILSDYTAKVIMNKTGAKFADIKYAALQLKREGAIDEEQAKKYFHAQPSNPAPDKDGAKPAKRRGRPTKKEPAEEKATAAPKKSGRRRRTTSATE